MNIIKKLLSAFETQGKYRTMILLRNLPDHQLQDVGISPALLAIGMKAWPWQLAENDGNDFPQPPRTSPNLMELHVGKVVSSPEQVTERSAA